jgi:asparagine synthase (glutamine-hydrolysing)
MGGIAGWVAKGAHAPDEGALVPVLAALAHRGSSGDGVFTFTTESGFRAVLGNAWYDEEAGIAVMLDGALANRHEIRSELAPRGYTFDGGDCAAEVLARAYQHWDKDVLHHLRGAFAFALWDARKERLLLGRDRLGEKPLYLHERGSCVYFASELRALVKVPGICAQPDPGAAHDYLAFRYVPAPRTLIAGIRKLMPGTHALWQFGRLRESRYWTPPDRNPLVPQRLSDPVAAFSEKLEEAVTLRLPAGILLSGGIDSASVLALASKHQKVKTFAAGFADDRHSELPRAAQVAKHFGAEHHEIVLSPRDIVARLAEAVARRDAPVSRPGDVALHFIAREAARSVKAVLTGEGADEILGGYRRHVAERYGWGLRSLPTFMLLAAPLARRRPRLQTALASLRTNDWRQRIARWVGVLGDGERRKLVPVAAKTPTTQNPLPPFDAHPNTSNLRRALYFDQASWLPDNVLERADRMTMAATLEARAPFLDHRLVELVSTLPDDWRVRRLETKRILRQAAKPLLAGLKPRKAGFRVPVGEWLRGELRDYLVGHLRDGTSLTRPYYEARVLDRLLDEHLAGKRNHETLLWTLLNLEIWHRASRPA